MSTFSPNIQFEEVARGGDVGTWDTPTNSNWTLADSALGAITTISLNNSNVVLSGSQFQSKQITFNSTLTGSVVITFPTSFTKSYEIQNLCTGSSAFLITLTTTAAGAQQIACPPGVIFDCVNDGTNIKFKNLPQVGSYWDYVGSSVPAWVTGCSVPPWVNCDGTSISSATYPVYAALFGTTLPNSKGRVRFALDQGAGNISSAATGFNGSSVGSVGGQQTITLGTSNLPAYTPSGSITPVTLLSGGTTDNYSSIAGFGTYNSPTKGAATFTGNAQGGVAQPITDLPPAYIGGITMVRVA